MNEGSTYSTRRRRRHLTLPARELGSVGIFFKPDSKPDTPVVTWENNICPAYLRRLLEDSSELFYKVQSDLQTQGFIIIKNTSHLPLERPNERNAGYDKEPGLKGEKH